MQQQSSRYTEREQSCVHVGEVYDCRGVCVCVSVCSEQRDTFISLCCVYGQKRVDGWRGLGWATTDY